MLIDITGTKLTPGNQGKNCLGNGLHSPYPCCCDECDYMLCCLNTYDMRECTTCRDADCPRSSQT